MFFGEFGYRIDQKGRVPIPPRFRRELGEGLVLAPGPEKCIVGYSLPEWQKLSTNVPSGSLATSKMRRLNRAMFATAFHLTFDSQGRIPLPVSLRKYADITDELVVIGTNNCLELWNKEQWESERATSQEQMWQIIEGQERR